MGQADRQAKLLLKTILSPWASVKTEEEVALSPQKIDVLVFLNPQDTEDCHASDAVIKRLGLLGSLLQECTILEPYSRALVLSDFDDIQRKQLALQHQLEKEHSHTTGQDVRLPRPKTWMITTDDSPIIRTQLQFVASTRHGPSIYETAPVFAVGWVVLAQLPKTRDTLALRLLDRGGRLLDAIEDVLVLPVDDPLLKDLLFVIHETRLIEVNPMSDPDRLTPEVIAKFDEAIALRDRILREEAIRETEQKVEALLAKEREAKEAAVVAEQAALKAIEREREAKEAALKELAELKAKLGLPLLRLLNCHRDSPEVFFCVKVSSLMDQQLYSSSRLRN